MKERTVKDVPASVRQRLLNLSRKEGWSFEQVLQFYAIECFLARLARTQWVSSLVVKGAAMLRVWNAPLARPTRDIDFLGYLPNNPEAVLDVVRDCLVQEMPEEGLLFREDIDAQPVIVEDRYPGVRVVIRGQLSGAAFRLQLDVAVDDVVVPDPGWVTYPALLGAEGPRILAYMPPTALAEKFEIIVSLGETTSRLKDFYDIWLLVSTLDLDGRACAGSMRATFAHRGTPLPSDVPFVLTEGFLGQPETSRRWRSFLRRAGVEPDPGLDQVLKLIQVFAMPIAQAPADDVFARHWPRGGPWQPVGEAGVAADN